MKVDGFEELLVRLAPAHVANTERYAFLRQRLIKYFSWRRAEEPEELADEAISRIVARLSSEPDIEKPWPYIYGVAQNVFRESLRLRTKRAMEVVAYQAEPDRDFIDCARSALAALSADKRRLLEAFYSDETDREALAKSLGLSLAALRTMIHRIKRELREGYQRCMEMQLGKARQAPPPEQR